MKPCDVNPKAMENFKEKKREMHFTKGYGASPNAMESLNPDAMEKSIEEKKQRK